MKITEQIALAGALGSQCIRATTISHIAADAARCRLETYAASGKLF